MPDHDPMRETGGDLRLERFDRTFRDRYEQVRRFAARCGAGDPDDVASEAFSALWRRLDDVEPGAERAWLFAAARRAAANERRGARRRSALADRVGASEDALAEPARTIADPAVAEALARLSPGDRELLALATWGELEAGELATVLGTSRPAVAVRLHRARRRFRAAYLDIHPQPLTSAPSTGGASRAR